MAGVQLLNVPYRGGPQALTDVMAGQVHLMFGTLAITQPQIQAGRLKALGVSTRETHAAPAGRADASPSRGAPGYEMSIWWGVLAPAGMPATFVAKLNTEIGAILSEPETAQRLRAEGAEPSPMPGAAVRARARFRNREMEARRARIEHQGRVMGDAMGMSDEC